MEDSERNGAAKQYGPSELTEEVQLKQNCTLDNCPFQIFLFYELENVIVAHYSLFKMK